MGQKVHPIAFRLGHGQPWTSRWFLKHGAYRAALKEDATIRRFLKIKLKDANLTRVEIERSASSVTVTLSTAKPGLIIGRGGTGVEALKADVKKLLADPKTALSLNIQEVDRPNLSAAIAVQAIIADIEKRMPFRRSMKQTLSRLMKAGADGAKIVVSGRLDGSEIARTEKQAQGKVPLHTIRANIDYYRGAAFTTYGVVGVKVWVYRGEGPLPPIEAGRDNRSSGRPRPRGPRPM